MLTHRKSFGNGKVSGTCFSVPLRAHPCALHFGIPAEELLRNMHPTPSQSSSIGLFGNERIWCDRVMPSGYISCRSRPYSFGRRSISEREIALYDIYRNLRDEMATSYRCSLLSNGHMELMERYSAHASEHIFAMDGEVKPTWMYLRRCVEACAEYLSFLEV